MLHRLRHVICIDFHNIKHEIRVDSGGVGWGVANSIKFTGRVHALAFTLVMHVVDVVRGMS